MVEVKPLERVVRRWTHRASSAGADYQEGTTGKGQKWASQAMAAENNYIQGVTTAAQQKRYSRGIQRAGASAYESGVAEKGVQRYPTGISASQDKYQKRISEVLSTISGVQLPPKGPKGSPQNYQRVQAVGQALRAKFKGGQ